MSEKTITLHRNPLASDESGTYRECYWQGIPASPYCQEKHHLDVVPVAALAAAQARIAQARLLLFEFACDPTDCEHPVCVKVHTLFPAALSSTDRQEGE